MIRKIITGILSLTAAICILAGCGRVSEETLVSEVSEDENVSADGVQQHLIGVVTYDFSDAEVAGFRNYLQNYISQCFPGVEFLYTDEVTSLEEEIEELHAMNDAGVEGILSFVTYDLYEAVNYCSENDIYYMMASGTISDKDFNKVSENEHFVGVIGPGNEMEYEAGRKLAGSFSHKTENNAYFVLSGGAYMGNEMHRLRTEGVLDKLQEDYGVKFAQTSQEIAESTEPTIVQAGDLTVCICPGFMNVSEHYQLAISSLKSGSYSAAMAVMAAGNFPEECETVHTDFGMIDSFTEENQFGFINGRLSYLAGKYSSIIGPSFVAMYNAVCGYADEFRDNGKAFSLQQGFWEASSLNEYIEKYSLASGIYVNAYNYNDLQSACKVYNPNASLEDLRKLTDAYSYEEASERRKAN